MTKQQLKMPRPVPVFEGQLVFLRPIEPEKDAHDYYQMNLEPEMHLWTGNKVFESVEEAKAELERLRNIDEITVWMIIDKPSYKVIGRFVICLEETNDKLVAGESNRIAKPYWRKGHNKEARKLIFKFVFEELNADRIESKCWSENKNSFLSLKAHGFKFVKEISEFNGKYKQTMKLSIFRLTKKAWENLYRSN